MRIPQSLKGNRFKVVRIPSKSEHFKMEGFLEPTSAMFSGDEEARSRGRKSDAYSDSMNFHDELEREKDKDKNKE